MTCLQRWEMEVSYCRSGYISKYIYGSQHQWSCTHTSNTLIGVANIQPTYNGVLCNFSLSASIGAVFCGEEGAFGGAEGAQGEGGLGRMA